MVLRTEKLLVLIVLVTIAKDKTSSTATHIFQFENLTFL